MALQIQLQKPGMAPVQKFALNLTKRQDFIIEAFWDDDKDLDLAVLGLQNLNGAKKATFDWVLSTFISGLPKVKGGEHQVGDKDAFQVPSGALVHSGDARSGIGNTVDEVVTVYGPKLPSEIVELPVIATIYPQAQGSLNFGSVKNAGVRIKTAAGAVLQEFLLSKDFAPFDGAQMGSIVFNGDQLEFNPVGSGFNGSFQAAAEHFIAM